MPLMHVQRSSVVRRGLAYAIYPAMTLSGIGFGLWACAAGWPIWLTGIVAIAAATALTELFERLVPYSAAWARPHHDRWTDFLHLAISNRAFDVGTVVAIAVFVPWCQRLATAAGTDLWPHQAPILAQTLLAIIVFELPWYWIHRLGHASPLCWRVHSVHHSSRRIYWWNFSRNHPLDNLVSAFVSYAPLALLGVGEAPLTVMVAFSAAHGLLQHSNIDLRTGVLNHLLSTAEVHRWHHSPHRLDADANYSPRLLLWDHVFGSFRRLPQRPPPEDVGLGARDAGFPQTFAAQMAIPFRAAFWRTPR